MRLKIILTKKKKFLNGFKFYLAFFMVKHMQKKILNFNLNNNKNSNLKSSWEWLWNFTNLSARKLYLL